MTEDKLKCVDTLQYSNNRNPLGSKKILGIYLLSLKTRL